MQDNIFIYPIKTGNKQRLITTYRNTVSANKLKTQHQEILDKIDVSIFDYKHCFAYLPQQNIRKLVKQHQTSTYFMTCDIKSFFDSIDHHLLLEKIKKYNLDNLITQQTLKSLTLNPEAKSLGIGMLLSPFLSNLYLIDFDQAIKKYTAEHGIIYTRYADDLSFSAQEDFDYSALLNIIETELNLLKLILNNRKTHIANISKSYASIKLLGLNIVNGRDNHYITVSRNYKQQVNKQLIPSVRQGMKNHIIYNDDNYML